LRKAEGGVRATAHKSCFTDGCNTQIDNYRPVWWFTDKEKQEYKSFFNLTFSDCYEVYGFKRTGCAGCPYNSNFEKDLREIQKFEPKLYNAVNNIFKESYEYTRAYLKFREQQKRKGKPEQISFF
jgi:hypothetical protein